MAKEIWKDVVGYEGLYQVSNLGRVCSVARNGTNGGVLKPDLSNKGYHRYKLSKNNKVKKFFCHRLVSLAFVPEINNKPFINHINGVKTDNRVENLEWCTHSENVIHSYKNLNPNVSKGEDHHLSKLTASQVSDIRKIYSMGGISQGKIAKYYGVSYRMIYKIVNRLSWKHID